MAERSYFWSCAEIGDGGLDSFSQEKVMTILGMFNVAYNPELSGVVPWKNTNTSVFTTLGLAAPDPVVEELLPSYQAVGDPRIRIEKGIGVSGGTVYIQTTATAFSIATYKSGFANAVDRIVLRRSLVSQTTRLVWVKALGIGLTAPLQNDATFWDVPIARITLDGAGNYSSLIDDRRYVTSPDASRIELYDYELATSPTIQVLTMPIGNLRYRELELLIDIQPVSTNSSIDIYFLPQPTNPYYNRQEIQANGATLTSATIAGTTYWRWVAPSGSKTTLEIVFPMFNRYNNRSILQGERVGFYRGRGGALSALPYLSGSLVHGSTSTVSTTLTDLVVSLDLAGTGTSYVPDGKVTLYGVK